MPICIPKYHTEERYLPDKNILIRKRICTIVSEKDLWGDRTTMGGPGLIDYTVNERTVTSVKTAYVKLGNVPLGWFSSTPEQGIYVEETPIPEPFEWEKSWPPLTELVDCDVESRIREEFGININDYV